jgi:GT2 family glycosyltransferase
MDTMPRVSIIILNWNGWKDTIECLESVYQITYPNYDVIVVDNGSENESIEKIKEYAEGKLEVTSKFFKYSRENKPLHYIEYILEETRTGGGKEGEIADLPSGRKFILIKNGKNYGFAEGNNIAIRYALKVLNPEYILLLNNDTIVDRTFLDELVNVADSDGEIGFIGPKTYYYDYHGQTDVINFAGGQLMMWRGKPVHIGWKEKDQGQYDNIADVDYVEGSCLLARQKTLEAIGLLNPAYYLYWEETDWCMRARKAGFRLMYAPKAKIWHKVAASSKINKPITEYYITRNRTWFVMQNGNLLQRLGYTLFLGYLVPYKICVALLYYRDLQRCKQVLNGFKDGFHYSSQ